MSTKHTPTERDIAFAKLMRFRATNAHVLDGIASEVMQYRLESTEALLLERDRLGEALAFYANPKNYKGDNTLDLSDGGIDRGGGYRLSANFDGGKIARAALNREEKR